MNLPRPYPDELIGSVLSRAVIHNGLPPKRLIHRLTGTAKTNYSPFLPTDLPELATKVRMSPKELLDGHTVFSYAVSFMAAEDVVRLEQKALAGCSDGQSSLSSLVKSVTHSAKRWRYCPECAKEELRERGESYWHRFYCLPGVHVCIKHRSPLLVPAQAPRTLSQFMTMPLPHKQCGTAEPHVAPTWARDTLASMTYKVVFGGQEHRTDWYRTYRGSALDRGYVLAGGNVAGTRLAHEVQQAYGPAYLSQIGCDFPEPQKSWPALMVREGVDVPFAPVKHMLLGAFLEHAPKSNTVFAYMPPGPKATDLVDTDRRLADAVMKEAAALLKRGERTTVQGLMRNTGKWQLFRHNRDHLPLTAAQLEEFKKTDASERKAGGREAHSKKLAAIAEGRQKPFPSWRERPQRDSSHERQA